MINTFLMKKISIQA